jgi:hypothetical protein
MRRIAGGFRIASKAIGLTILIIGILISFYTFQVKGLDIIGAYLFFFLGLFLIIIGILMIITKIENT